MFSLILFEKWKKLHVCLAFIYKFYFSEFQSCSFAALVSSITFGLKKNIAT